MLDELGISADLISFDARLMEASFGECEGLTEAEVAKNYPEFWQARTTDRWSARPPSGESYGDLSSRVSEWYNDVELVSDGACDMSRNDLAGFAWHLYRSPEGRDC